MRQTECYGRSQSFAVRSEDQEAEDREQPAHLSHVGETQESQVTFQNVSHLAARGSLRPTEGNVIVVDDGSACLGVVIANISNE